MASGSSILRSQMAPVFLKVYGAAGGDVAALIARHGLPKDAAEQREVDLSLDALDEIAEAAAAQANDPNLGMHLAIRLPRGSYGLLEYIGRSASTIRQAGERFLRYSTLLNDLVSFRFEDGKLTQRVEGHAPCVGRHAGEMFIALAVRYLREMANEDWAPTRVGFAHRAPPDTSEHESWFKAPISWGGGINYLEIPPSILDRSVVTRDEMLFSVLDVQAQQLIASRPAKTDALARVREAVRAALEDGNPNLGDVAKRLRTSPRTLQRRLGAEGTSFQDVVDSVREELARIYMADTKRKYTVGELAYLLGFSEISALSRAFKRWTGMTPTQWRDRSNDLA
jgi:AraC-like DNA-binding protein